MNRSPHRISGQRSQARKRKEPNNQRRMEEVEGEDDEEEDDISQSLTELHLKDAQPSGECFPPHSADQTSYDSDNGGLIGGAFTSRSRNLVYKQSFLLPQEEVGGSAVAESLQDHGDHEERAPLQVQQDTQILPLPQEEVGGSAVAESLQDHGDHEERAPLPQDTQNLPFPQEVEESDHDQEVFKAGAPVQVRPQEDDLINSVHHLVDHEFDEFLQETEEERSIKVLESELKSLSEASTFAIPILTERDMMRIYGQLSNPKACLSCHREEMEVVVLPCGHKYVCRDCFHRYFEKVLPFKCFICHSKCTEHNFL